MPHGGCYLFLGPDRSRKRQRITQLIEALGISPLDHHEISAAEWSSSRLLALAREHPAASPVRLIVIDDAHRLDGACLSVLTEQLEVLTQLACLVLLVETELPAHHPLTTLASRVTVEPFAGLSSPDARATRFAAIEAVARRDVAAALHAVHEHLASGKEIVELVGLLVWQLQRWLTVSHLLEAGVERERIETLTGLRAWQLERVLAELAGRPPAVLRQALRRCWELDVATKTGRTIPRLALEELIVELCLPRPLVLAKGRGHAQAVG